MKERKKMKDVIVYVAVRAPNEKKKEGAVYHKPYQI
jgi:hypothetical protein